MDDKPLSFDESDFRTGMEPAETPLPDFGDDLIREAIEDIANQERPVEELPKVKSILDGDSTDELKESMKNVLKGLR